MELQVSSRRVGAAAVAGGRLPNADGSFQAGYSRFETLLELAEAGCLLEFDMFGHESSYYPLTEHDMPSDAQRLDLIERLIGEGLTDRLLVSQDICTRHRLLRFGFKISSSAKPHSVTPMQTNTIASPGGMNHHQ